MNAGGGFQSRGPPIFISKQANYYSILIERLKIVKKRLCSLLIGHLSQVKTPCTQTGLCTVLLASVWRRTEQENMDKTHTTQLLLNMSQDSGSSRFKSNASKEKH